MAAIVSGKHRTPRSAERARRAVRIVCAPSYGARSRGAVAAARERPGSRPQGRWFGKWVRLAGFLALAFLHANAAWADSRTQHPLQIQLEYYGLSVGYHFSELIYVGATRQFGVAGNRFHGRNWMGGSGDGHGMHDQNDEDGLYGQRGVADDQFEYGDRTGIEVRFSPERFGVYLALGVLILEPDQEQVVWDERSRIVGQGSYTTGLTADIEGKRATVPAVGAGINHVFQGGLSLGAGFLYGVEKPDPPSVRVSATNSTVSQSDLDRLEARIRRDFNDLPVMVHLAAGFNF